MPNWFLHILVAFHSEGLHRVSDVSEHPVVLRSECKIPSKLLKYIGVSSARIRISAENLFTITKWPGLDPEKLPKSGSEIPYPLMKNYSLGINVTL